MKHAFLLLMLLLCASEPRAAEPITVGESVIFDSKQLASTIKLSIAIPESYRQDSTHRYPVLYLLDGHYLFLPVVGNLRYLSAFVEAPEMLVVALYPTQKALNFTPSVGQDMSVDTGGAAQFLAFMTEELIPYVEQHYPADRYRVLLGHSISGLFSYWVLNTRPDLFGAYVAISPSLWWDDEMVVALSKEVGLQRSRGLQKSLYLNLANEPGKMQEAYVNTVRHLRHHAPDSLRWQAERLPHETHASSPLPSSVRALRWLFEGWNATPDLTVKRLSELKVHYEVLAERLGMVIRLSENQYNLYGLHAAREGQPTWGVEILQEGVVRFPRSHHLWDSLGEALQLNGQTQQAITHVRKALAVAKDNGITSAPVIEAHLKRLTRPEIQRDPGVP